MTHAKREREMNFYMHVIIPMTTYYLICSAAELTYTTTHTPRAYTFLIKWGRESDNFILYVNSFPIQALLLYLLCSFSSCSTWLSLENSSNSWLLYNKVRLDTIADLFYFVYCPWSTTTTEIDLFLFSMIFIIRIDKKNHDDL